MRNIDLLTALIRSQDYLSPVTRQVLINRMDLEPTEREIQRAREQLAGRIPVTA